MRHPSRDERNPSAIVDRLIVRLWETIDELESLEPPEKRFFRVAIFGSARIREGDHLYESVREFGYQIGRLGCDIVTGGGPGLMAAANSGAKSAIRDHGVRIRSYGLTIDLAREEAANPFVDRMTAHRTFFSRLHHFVRMSHAYVVFPGGIGTLLETLMIWQLLQVGHIPARPLIFVGKMHSGLLEWMRSEMVARRLVDASDLGLVAIVAENEVHRAVSIIQRAKEEFDQSMERAQAERAGAASAGDEVDRG